MSKAGCQAEEELVSGKEISHSADNFLDHSVEETRGDPEAGQGHSSHSPDYLIHTLSLHEHHIRTPQMDSRDY